MCAYMPNPNIGQIVAVREPRYFVKRPGGPAEVCPG
jgi:hypothetical protein